MFSFVAWTLIDLKCLTATRLKLSVPGI